MNKKYSWHKIADDVAEINFSSFGIASVIVSNKTICIVKYQNMLFACAQKCPHAGQLLYNGYVDNFGNIVCPLHRYKFNLQNGRNTSGEGYFLKTYPIEIRENGIFVSLQKNNLFD